MSTQFGAAEPGLVYQRRETAFGLASRDGRLACVKVERDGECYHDLPGGAVDGDETEAEALVREFGEETGLTVRPVTRLVEAGQYFRKSDGEPVNNVGGVWTVEILDEDPCIKVEDDHTLVLLDPMEVIAILRHDSHAWAVAAWLRKRYRSELRGGPAVDFR